MAGYMGDMHADANAAYHQQAYHPQQAMINVDGSDMERMDQAYIGGGEAMISNVDYLAANGYYPPPQAPRMSAAAARASSMAAMYYNPTLHPQHAFSSNVMGSGDPWMPAYRPRKYGQGTALPPAYQHQQLEHHLMTQNTMAKAPGPAYQPGYVPGHGSEQHLQQAAHYQPRHSYPDDGQQVGQHRQWNNGPYPTSAWAWQNPSYGHGQHQVTDATPTAYNTQRGATYLPDSKQQQQHQYGGNVMAPAPHSHSHSHSLSQPQPLRVAESNWVNGAQGEVWNGRGAGWPPAYRPDGYHGNWQDGAPRWNHANDNHNWNRNGPVDDPSYALGATHWREHYPHNGLHAAPPHEQVITAPAATYQPQPDTHRQYRNEDVGPHDNVTGAEGGPEGNKDNLDHHEPVDDNKTQNSGPAPPSPETLDKSSVPISSVGAEIVWSACAALLDPGLLEVCRQSDMEEERKGRGRTYTGASTPASAVNGTPHTPNDDWSHSPTYHLLAQQRNHRTTCKLQPLQRLAFGTGEATASSEESSASSSEPGTPPSSFPSHLYDDLQRSGGGRREKVKSLSTVQGFRGLGLTSSDLLFSPREYPISGLSASPQIEQKTSLRDNRQSDPIAGVLNLVSPFWKWSINDDKLESLSASLRDGAKVDISQTAQKPIITYSAMKRSASANANRTNSPHGDFLPSGFATPGSEPSPAFRRFAHQVLAQTLMSPTAFMLAMMYSIRVPYLAIQTNTEGVAYLDPEATEIFANPPSAAPFKLFTLGLMIANKHLDDNTFLNKTWNEVTGISLSELNRMERWYLEKSSYEITVPEEPWVMFLERLTVRTERKLATIGDTRRYRVSTKHRPSASVSSVPNVAAATASRAGNNEEALKRLLLSIDEALVSIGRITPFDLSNAQASRTTSKRYSPVSPDVAMLSESQRPNTSLHLLHQHCHSAPALHQNELTTDSDVDVFEDENGPYRPQGVSIRSSIEKSNRKGSLESVLNRSLSDTTATTPTWQQLQRTKSMLGDDTRMSEAPLAPSVLLDLLNRGQHFAHAAH